MSTSEEVKVDSEPPEMATDKVQDNEQDVAAANIPKDDNSGSLFKTPGFIIPSKKKVMSNTNTGGMFKTQDIGPQKTYQNSSENKISTKPEHEEPDTEAENNKVETDSAGSKNAEVKKDENIEEALLMTVPAKKPVVLSPAEQLKQSQTAVPYKEPSWGGVCDEKYAFEVIKTGTVIDNVDLTKKSFYSVGRLPSCDIPMEHPSLSRYHAVLQYSSGKAEQYPRGWYLFDLDSTHGTWINKNKVPAQTFHRLHVDYVLKFGGSTRLFILHGPETDREDESELSATEMKEQREKQKMEAELLRQAEEEEAERKAELVKQMEAAKGCSWGIDEEEAAADEDENAENPFASIEPENEDLYINDPKKALNRYFEREGLELPEYEFHDSGFGKWKCTLELPIDAPNGESLVAEVIVSGKKKEAVVACALEACRILDKHGELRKSAKESRKRKEKNWEDDDFYDSDEDIYLDRTGAIEKKREFRKSKVGKTDKNVETYDSLLEKHKKVSAEIEEIEAKLEHAKAQAAAMESEEVDALDAYMSAIRSGMMDTRTKMKLKTQLIELKQEEQRIRKLINIAKPATLPEIKPKAVSNEIKKSGVLANVGKIKGLDKNTVTRRTVPVSKKEASDERFEEVEEDEEEENKDTFRLNSDVADGNSLKVVESAPNNLKLKTISETNYSKMDFRADSLLKGPSLQESEERSKVPEKSGSGSRMKGPTLPLSAVLEKLAEEAEDQNEDIADKSVGKLVENSGKRKSKGSAVSSKKVKVGEVDYDTTDPDYAVWLPPKNQSGDGKTHLNEKLGY